MRVSISYSVDLESVPNEVDKLLGECEGDLREIHGKFDRAIGKSALDLIKEIDIIRLMLVDFDARLSDCSNILTGYVDLKNSQNGVSKPPPLEVEDDNETV